MKFKLLFYALMAMVIPPAIFASPPRAGKYSALTDAVILVIRHAEKPDGGYGLSPAGEARAQAYVSYFKNFMLGGQPLKPDYIFAAADSKQSHRPRLTLEPTSKSLGLVVDSRFKDKQFQELAAEIESKPHGKAILIAWHHGEIPQLIQALGANSAQLFPKGKWPEAVFNQLIELRYDADGRLIETRLINEPF